MTQILGKAEVSLKDIETDLLLLRRTLRSTNVDLQVRVPLRSENYVPGAAGWNFDLDGNAELNNVTARGTIEANGIFAGTLDAGTVNAINISASQITADFLSVDRLQVNSINGNRISNNTLDGGKITNGTIGAGKIGNLEITADKIANLTIDASKIMNLQINSDKIGNGAVTNIKVFANINASKITAGAVSGISGNFVSLASVGITVNVNAGVFNAGLNSTSGSFSSLISNSGMPFSTDTTLQIVRRRSDNILVRTSSSARFKNNIEPAPVNPSLLLLEPKTWESAAEGDVQEKRYYGLIAEEVHELGLNHFVYYNEDDEPEGVSNEMVGVALLPIVRDISRRLEELENKNG